MATWLAAPQLTAEDSNRLAAAALDSYDTLAVRAGSSAFPSVPKPNLQPDFNVHICDSFDARSSAGLRELDESNRFIQKSAESTSI
jgi:hypothetical protein